MADTKRRAQKTFSSLYPEQYQREGVLRKKSPKGLQPWQTRYFVLKDGLLEYYDEVEKRKLKGSLRLEDVASVGVRSKKKKKLEQCRSLEVVHYSGTKLRSYCLQASSPGEATEWVEAIRLAHAAAVSAAVSVRQTGPVPFEVHVPGCAAAAPAHLEVDVSTSTAELRERVVQAARAMPGAEMALGGLETDLLAQIHDHGQPERKPLFLEDMENAPISTLQALRRMRRSLQVTVTRRAEGEQYRKLQEQISELIGSDLRPESMGGDDECHGFHVGLSKALAETSGRELSATDAAFLTPARCLEARGADALPNEDMLCDGFFPKSDTRMSLTFRPNETIGTFRARMYSAYSVACQSEDIPPESEFLLKLVGRSAFLCTDQSRLEVDRLGDFAFVHSAAHTDTTVKLMLFHNTMSAPAVADASEFALDLSKFKPRREGAEEEVETRALHECKAMFRLRVVEVHGLDLSRKSSGHSDKHKHSDPSTPKKSATPTHSSETARVNTDMDVCVSAGLYHGGELLVSLDGSELERVTVTNAASRNTWIGEWLEFAIRVGDLPPATRITFSLFAGREHVGWANFLLLDHHGRLREGMHALRLWPDMRPNPLGTVLDNMHQTQPATLFVECDTYPRPWSFAGEPQRPPTAPPPLAGPEPSAEELEQLEGIVRRDPLSSIPQDELELVWRHREHLLRNKAPGVLPKLVRSVHWADHESVAEAHALTQRWGTLPPHEALELLGPRYADPIVRAFAVRSLRQFSDEDLEVYILQLVQVIKYEAYHDSPIARMLVERATMSPTIGHKLFWHLKAEVHVPEYQQRFSLLLEAYLQRCGPFRSELVKEQGAMSHFLAAALAIKTTKDPERLSTLRGMLTEATLPEKFRLPLDPHLECSSVNPAKCRFMDSKKLPVWLNLGNADETGDPVIIIFKAGDDLRQDMLTLQMIGLMDRLWQSAGLDLCLNAYGCVATGDEIGMMEVVLNSETTSSISQKAGGGSACFKEEPIARWLREHNPTDEAYTQAVENFIRSVAGYCVATCVLGIGDRHNDNVMLQKTGKLFHIDFGHFLGNFKSKFGFKRERAKFVLTPDFVYVMGGTEDPRFERFCSLCEEAFNILRSHASLFINLFVLMLSSGMPELQREEDIEYMRDSFLLDFTNEAAGKEFRRWIYESLNCRMTQINNAIHSIVHRH